MTYHLSRRLSALENSLGQQARPVCYVWLDDLADAAARKLALERARRDDSRAELVVIGWQAEGTASAPQGATP